MSDTNIVKKDNFKIKYLIGIGIVLVIILFIICLFFNTNRRLNKAMINSGKKFYSEFYYKKITDGKNKKQIEADLENFKSIGIKVNLNTIKNYSYDVNKRNIKFLEKKKCDITKTNVVIYPKSPYGKNDITVKANLDCK